MSNEKQEEITLCLIQERYPGDKSGGITTLNQIDCKGDKVDIVMFAGAITQVVCPYLDRDGRFATMYCTKPDSIPVGPPVKQPEVEEYANDCLSLTMTSPPPSELFDMSEAPRDGRRVMLFRKSGKSVIARYTEGTNKGFIKGPQWITDDYCVVMTISDRIVAWRPLGKEESVGYGSK